MALNSDDLKDKLINDVGSVSSQYNSSINQYYSDYERYRNGEIQSEPTAPAVPDFMKVISDSISEYLTDNMELVVAWVAQTTSAPPVPDPFNGSTFNAKVSEVDLGLDLELVRGISDSNTFNTTVNGKYKISVGSIEIAANQIVDDVEPPQFTLTPVSLSILSTKATITFGSSENSGTDAFNKNMGVLAKSVVDGIVGVITPIPLSGSHAGFVSTSTSSITEIL